MENLSPVTDFVHETFSAFGCPGQFLSKIDIVVEEIFTNIASYAYPESSPERPVEIDCALKDGYAYLIFSDGGVPFNPLAKGAPATGNADEMTIGGYGIFMVKKIMDTVEYRYEREEGKNVLLMRKRIF